MTDNRMLQLIVDALSSLREEVRSNHKEVTEKIDTLDKKLTKRIDRLGYDLAELQDDAPTREEYDVLEKRVTKVEKKLVASN